jgi:hypothetical protein
LQAGFSEEWLCSIFSNLTDELHVALRAATVSAFIIHKYNMMRAESSTYNRMRLAMGWLFGRCNEEDQVILSFDKRFLYSLTAGSAQQWQDQPWRYEGSGMEDEELGVFDRARVGIARSA